MIEDFRAALPTAPYPELHGLVADIRKRLCIRFSNEWPTSPPPLSVYLDPADRTKAVIEVTAERKTYLIVVYGTRIMFVVPKEPVEV
jgi:hypothetical protein